MRGSFVVLVIASGCAHEPERPLDAMGAQPDAATERTFATYTIAPGSHSAQLSGREPRNPIDGVVSVVGRDFELALNASAVYELALPTEPEDQLDWNKLPGLSDCGAIDLAKDGAMFGWRWRLDVTPPVLEVTAYANNAGQHLWLAAPLFTLDVDDLAADEPLRYVVVRDADHYQFSVTGEVRSRTIDVTATHPRRCRDEPTDPLAWASAFYFGGTSTAPHEITARIRETTY